MKAKIIQLHDIANMLMDMQPEYMAEMFEFAGCLKQSEMINCIAKNIALYGAHTTELQTKEMAKNLTKEGLAWLECLVKHAKYWNEKGEIL